MIRTHRMGLFVIAILAVFWGQNVAQAQALLRCGPFTQAVLDVPLTFSNPNPFPLPLGSLTGEFRIEGADVGRIASPELGSVNAREARTVAVPTLRGSAVHLTVPPGTQNGARLRLRGLGMPHVRGDGAGDLIAEMDVRVPVPVPEELRSWAEQAIRH